MKEQVLVLSPNAKGASLQQIPLRIRQAFVAPQGSSLVSIDYTQIEYLVFAVLSGDAKLKAAIESGKDFHTAIASIIFSTPYDKVTPDQRAKGKLVNFSLLYGGGVRGLAMRLKISESEASKIFEIYFNRFPVATKWRLDTLAKVKRERKAATFFGHIRSFTGEVLTDSDADALFNTIIQGTAADIIKIAMIKLSRFLAIHPEMGKMVLSLHDEIIFEVPDSELHKVPQLANVMTGLNLGEGWIPLRVKTAVGKNWAEVSK